jgi:DNA relaxase NicK
MKMSEYIFSILKGGNIFILLSWGASEFEVIYDKYKEDNGLKFKVNGHHHKGYVEVHYDGCSDLFIVILKNKNGEVLETINDVYFDVLQDIIDTKVERIDEYVV